jgi:hypothetical protein
MPSFDVANAVRNAEYRLEELIDLVVTDEGRVGSRSNVCLVGQPCRDAAAADDEVDGDYADRTGWARPHGGGWRGRPPGGQDSTGEGARRATAGLLDTAAPQDYSEGMSEALPEDSNAAVAWMWGQYVWVPLTWRLDRRWGLHSAIARAMKTWLEDHVRSIEAEGLTGPSNVSTALELATTEGRHLLDQLETEFPPGTDPLTDAAAQEAIRRIVTRLRGEPPPG